MSPEEKQLYQRTITQYNSEDYQEAYKGFSQLLSLYPGEKSFRYYFGVCNIILRQDIKRGINLMEQSAEEGIHEAYLYLGIAHHKQYNFSKAAENYLKYKSNTKQREIRDKDIDRRIIMAENGQKLLQYAYELKVVFNRSINKQNFHYSYDFSDFGGKLLIKPESYRTRPDRNIKHPDLMYISDLHNVIFMSSYGNRRGGSLNIYVIKKDGDNWGEPQILPAPINDEFDQAFPFIAADGVTLYFASKGHSSMGGFDIFKSVYNTANSEWSEPENMDFPINTPFDDIMFVKDIHDETAFFASNRDVTDDRITIYRILLEKDPQQRLISNIDDVFRRAKLEVSAVAIAELNKRELERTIILTDSLDEQVLVMKDTITSSASEITDLSDDYDLIEESQKTIDDISDFIGIIGQMSYSSFNQSKNIINEIKSLRIEKEELQKNNASNQEILKIDTQIRENAQKAVILFEITRLGLSKEQSLTAQSAYYQTQLNTIQNAYNSQKDINKAVTDLKTTLNRIGLNSPAQEIIQQKQRLLKHQIEKSEELAQRIEFIEKGIYKTELDKKKLLQQFYQLEHLEEKLNIALEVKKVEEIQIAESESLKQLKINYEVTKNEIKNLAQEIDVADSFSYDQNVQINPYKLSEVDNDIELLRVYINQSNLKDIASSQNTIMTESLFDLRAESLFKEIESLQTLQITQNELTQNQELQNNTSQLIRNITELLPAKLIVTNKLLFQKDSLLAELIDLTKALEVEQSLSKQDIIKTDITQMQDKLQETKLSIISSIPKSTVEKQAKEEINKYTEIRIQIGYSDIDTIIKEADKIVLQLNNLLTHINEIEKSDIVNKEEDIFLLNSFEQYLSEQLSDKTQSISEYHDYKKVIESEDLAQTLKMELQDNIIIDEEIESMQDNLISTYEEIQRLKVVIESTDPENISKSIKELEEYLVTAQEQHTDFLLKKITNEKTKLHFYQNFTAKYDKFAPPTVRAHTKDISLLINNVNNLESQLQQTIEPELKAIILAEIDKNLELAVFNYESIINIITGTEINSLNDQLVEVNNKEKTLLLQEKANEFIAYEIPKNLFTKEFFYEDPIIDNSILLTILEKVNDYENKIKSLKTGYNKEVSTDSEQIINKIDSLNQILLNTLLIAKKIILKNQYERVSFYHENLQLNNKYPEISQEVADYLVKAKELEKSMAYYMLEEVIIQGNSILEKQFQVINKTIEQDELFKETQLFYNKANSNTDWINTAKIDISTQNDPSILDEYDNLKKLISENALLLSKYKQTEKEINETKKEIETISSDREKQKMILSLNLLEKEQTQNIIEMSEIRQDMVIDILDLAQNSENSEKNKILLADMQNAFSESSSLRKTIKDFSEFHSLEGIDLMHKRASELENEIISLYDNIKTSSSEKEIMEISQLLTENDIIPLDKEIITDLQKGLIKIDFEIIKNDKNLHFDLIEKQAKIDKSLNNKENLYSEIEDLKADLSGQMKRRQIKRTQRQLENLEQSFIKEIKYLAQLQSDLIHLKYTYAISMYSRIASDDKRLTQISDSIKRTSEYNIRSAQKNFEYIINYKDNNINLDLLNKYDKAIVNSGEAFKNIEKSINIYHSGTIPDEIALLYVPKEKQTEKVYDTKSDYITEFISEIPDKINTQQDFILIDSDDNISHYNDTNPIQTISETQSGITYRIQIGAFNRPVPNETFKGISPILIETLPQSRLLRYVVGLFYSFENANASLPIVRDLGYNDCFIVAYFNGERISVYQARQMENLYGQKGVSSDTGISITPTISDQTSISETTSIHTNIRESQEVFFCIQIGVYKRLVEPINLYGISPIMYEQLSNGLIRHFYGKYTNYDDAVAMQNRIRQLGINDAFITAYRNGQRISNTEARRLFETQNTQSSAFRSEAENIYNAVQDSATNISLEIPVINKPSYYVQIGAYRRPVNNETKKYFESIARNNNVDEVSTSSGLIIYRIGEFTSYETATSIQEVARNEGISDAFIVSYLNGERISNSEARRLELSN